MVSISEVACLGGNGAELRRREGGPFDESAQQERGFVPVAESPEAVQQFLQVCREFTPSNFKL